ncbi:MAG: hypothetical protein KKF48_05270 [Nanoarchaeota archaeon]|nr:hypothetical protein [Nanoarchaeota archaeon]MBU1028429.1 hypothetical protein [Nanoarchaeota archaeon]
MSFEEDLIPNGEIEALIELKVSDSVDSESSFRGYYKGLVDRGYKILASQRDFNKYFFRIIRGIKNEL